MIPLSATGFLFSAYGKAKIQDLRPFVSKQLGGQLLHSCRLRTILHLTPSFMNKPLDSSAARLRQTMKQRANNTGDFQSRSCQNSTHMFLACAISPVLPVRRLIKHQLINSM